MERSRVRLGSNGRFVIPAEYRKGLGVSEGDDLFIRLEGGELRISTAAVGIRHAQALVRQYVPKEAKLVDELIAERREEAAKAS